MSLTRYLARCSGLEDAETRAAMQSSKSLVINTLYLLRLVHQAAGERDLAVLNKLRDQVEICRRHCVSKSSFFYLCPQGDEDVSASPTFGFKDELISLLTGLVWDHAHNQTLVGAELGGVALLLDCSQIDARNPLITQVRSNEGSRKFHNLLRTFG